MFRFIDSFHNSERIEAKLAPQRDARAVLGRDQLELKITDIRMVDSAQLTDEQLAALGLSRDEFETLYGHQARGIHGWLICASPAVPESAHH